MLLSAIKLILLVAKCENLNSKYTCLKYLSVTALKTFVSHPAMKSR